MATLAAVLAVAGAAPAVAAGDNARTGLNDSPADVVEFDGYVGYVGDDPEAAMAAATSDGHKDEEFGAVGERSSDAQDVPGARAEADVSTEGMLPALPDDLVVADEVHQAVADGGRARVIVVLRTPLELEATLSRAEVAAQREAIAADLDRLGDTLADTDSREVLAFEVVPSAVYEVTRAGLDALLADPNVGSVTLDGQVQSQLDSSTGVIDSDLLNTAGVLGNNYDGSTTGPYAVGIIDSGVDSGHAAFAGRIVAQGCFVSDNSCPGGTDIFIGAPGGEECTHSSDCDHGTHVGGIAAGASYELGHEGVARGASIVALKVAEDSPTSTRWTAYFSSIDVALQHSINLKNGSLPNLVALNISIGTAATYTHGDPACNAVDPSTNLLFGQLQALGVAVVVAAGNSGATSAMSFPGCVSNAFAVGATTDADVPASFTNSSAGLRWWAPGVSITAPVPTGISEGTKDGTSMAAPHVAGAFALLRECVDGNGNPITNTAAATGLDNSGVDVTRNGVTRRRIDVLDAATSHVNNNDFWSAEVLPASPGASGYNDFDFNVCADAERAEPGPFSIENSVWWRWTPSATGTATISTEDGGGNVTTFDTQLTVSIGNSPTSQNVVAYDDDSGTGLRSLVVFPVNSGTTYRIRVDGFAGANGLLNLHVENGPPPTCQGVAATIVGTPSDDTFIGTVRDDVIVAGAGDDSINGMGGNDRICGDAGDDTLWGGGGNDLVFGGSGTDRIAGGPGDDTLLGNAGGGSTDDVGDAIYGGPGNDLLDGWTGDDILFGGPGNDTIGGYAGVDRADYRPATGPIVANLLTGVATGEGNDTFVEVERLAGSAHDDRLTGDNGVNVLWGRGGNDVLDGRGRRDTLNGGDGNDRLIGRGGNDRFNGEAGIDTVSFQYATAAVNANLTTGEATGEGNDTFATVENLIGSPQGDTLTGSGVRNVISGGLGNDDIRGGAGNDALNGNGGFDTIFGQLGNDVMNGGAGIDIMYGGEGNDTVNGNAGNDTLHGMTGNDQVNGGPGADNLNGGAGTDDCNGGAGVDTGVGCEVQVGIP